MIDIMGRRYIIEHIATEYRRRKVYEAYQIYVTDCLKGIADMNLKYFSHNNNAEAVRMRFAEILKPEKADKRTANEIADDILQRAGLSFAGDKE